MVRMKTVHVKRGRQKRGTQLLFSPKILPHRSFTLSFGFALTYLCLVSFPYNSSLNQVSYLRIRTSCKSSEPMIPSFAHFRAALLKLGMKQGIRRSNQAQDKVTSPPPQNQFISINKLACYGNNLSRNPLQGQLGGVLGCKKHSEMTENKQTKQAIVGLGEGTKRQTNHQTRSDS